MRCVRGVSGKRSFPSWLLTVFLLLALWLLWRRHGANDGASDHVLSRSPRPRPPNAHPPRPSQPHGSVPPDRPPPEEADDDAIASTVVVHPGHDEDIVQLVAQWPRVTKPYACVLGAYPVHVSDVLFASGRNLGKGVRERRLVVKRGDRFVGLVVFFHNEKHARVQRLSLLQPSSFDEWLRLQMRP